MAIDVAAAPENAYDLGRHKAQEALKADSVPIFAMNEMDLSPDETQYAMGWNSIYASEENRQRFSPVVIDPVVASVRAFVERSGGETNYLRLNHAD